MKAILFILLFFTALSACKDTDCPAFPENLIAYFPYIKGDVLKFTNQNSDTLSIYVEENWESESYSFAWNCKCACEADAGFKTDLENNFLLKIEGAIIIYNEDNSSEIECNFYDGEANGGGTFKISNSGINPFLPENTKLFGDTIKMENEGFTRFNNIVIVYGKGIVAFWDKNQNGNWIRID